jgi:hypothetical protein
MTDEKTLQLEEKIKQINALTESQVYADPIKKIQENMLSELLAMRADLSKSIEHACQAAAGGGSGNGELVSKKEYIALEQENKKLRYRITHLNRALDQYDGGKGYITGVSSGGEKMKLYTTSANSSTLLN